MTKILIAATRNSKLVPVRCDIWLQSDSDIDVFRKQQETLHSAYRIYFVVSRYAGILSPEIQRKTRQRKGVPSNLKVKMKDCH